MSCLIAGEDSHNRVAASSYDVAIVQYCHTPLETIILFILDVLMLMPALADPAES